MTRHQRQAHFNAFAVEEDFNTQLYTALRQSPWWMISLALHVVVFFVLTLFHTGEAEAEKAKTMFVSMPSDTVEVEPTEPPEDKKNVIESDLETPEPVLIEDKVQEHPESDNNLDHNETFGESDGLSNAPYVGPSNNGLIGLGANAGGAFPGRGGDGNGGAKGRPSGKRNDTIEDALRWLAAHQSADGGWEAAGFDRWCDGRPVSDAALRPDGLGQSAHDAGVTGLALCAFLGAGYTNRGRHPFARVVGNGLRYLKNIQDPEGCFGPRSSQQYIYSHATASLAMVEAYGMTGSPIWLNSAQRSLDFIALTRNPYFAWRYGVKPGDNDTSVSGWMMMALKSALIVNAAETKAGRKPPLSVDTGGFDGLRTWLDKVTDPDYGRVGYTARGEGSARPLALVDRFPGEKSEAMTAVGILARIFMGEDPRKSEVILKGAELCSKLPPRWNPTDGSIDMYYWYYGTLAMFQVGGRHWEVWRKAMDKSVVETQRRDTEYCLYKGSWDPIGPWGHDGGRVYSTAVMALCLEVYERYGQVFGAK
ncbi:MAG: terpene cyclase/mutase family protein [Planctomycetota bacterium]|nr:terpene cyclase/mutase family protein [Planctomycetota bacterium]